MDLGERNVFVFNVLMCTLRRAFNCAQELILVLSFFGEAKLLFTKVKNRWVNAQNARLRMIKHEWLEFSFQIGETNLGVAQDKR